MENLCNTTSLGEFILADNAEDSSKRVIRTEAIHIAKTERLAVNYPIEKTGYYCVETFAPEDQEYTAIVEFRNAYGELPAAQIAKLPFYGGMAIVYAVIGIFWGFLYVQHRQDILAVQNYITAIIVFLVIEMLMTWGFYDYQNRHGNNVGNKVFMIVVSILNAGRNSFSFFLLLIVCMGYGVVKHTLGKTMLYVRWLAVTHFVFGVIYAIASLTIRPDDAGPLVLLVILPLSATLTAFYIWTLNSLNMTMKDLVDRKQRVKFLMYKRLWWCILGSILVIFGFFFFNSFAFAGAGDPDFAPTHWQTRWFVLDGWLNLVYFADVCFVAYLWRPTANNRRFAMSDEVRNSPRTPLNNDINLTQSSRKTMKVSRLRRSKTLSTRKTMDQTTRLRMIPRLALTMLTIAPSPRFRRPNHKDLQRYRGRVSTETRSLPLEMTTSGRTTSWIRRMVVRMAGARRGKD